MTLTNKTIHPNLLTFSPELVIFDKDGTLIDFDAMWGSWIQDLVTRIASETGFGKSDLLYNHLGYDVYSGNFVPNGIAAAAPLAEFQQSIIDFLIKQGVAKQVATDGFLAAWFEPDPIALTQPLTDLTQLFTELHQISARVAVATSDNRALTEATLASLNITHLVDDIICADDGIPIKPEPDMIQHLCQKLGVLPNKTVMVGDNVVDLQMGRAANAGITIGVTSGVCTETELRPYADLVLASIDDLLVVGHIDHK
ncbi:MAG: HAD family hydrolase [Chloroflexota bacterium]